MLDMCKHLLNLLWHQWPTQHNRTKKNLNDDSVAEFEIEARNYYTGETIINQANEKSKTEKKSSTLHCMNQFPFLST